MSTPEKVQSERDVDVAPPPPSSPIGRIVIIALVGLLVVWTVVRVRTAQGEQARLLVERNAAAEAAKSERKDKPLVLTSAQPAMWTPIVRIEGTLEPVEEADLGFKQTGRLSSIRAKVGDYVHRGQTLATLEATESAAQLEQARAQVRASEAQLALAEDTERRTAVLAKSGAGSQQAELQTQQQRALAAAQADASRASVSLAQAMLENATLVSPFSGYVTKVPSGAGQVVTMNTPLFHVQNTAELKLAGTVGEADVALVQPGLVIAIDTPNGKVEGKVTAVLGSVDSATRRVPIEARIPNDPKHPLLAGTYVRSEVVGKTALPVLKLPTAVLRPGSQDEVMVAANGRMSTRHIVFSPAPEGMIYVRSGLDAKEQVILEPSPEAKDGTVLPAPAAAPASKP